MNENTDKMAQNDQAEEALARELNTDESIADNRNYEEEMDEEEKLRAELDETKDKYLRLVAEFDNFRRRNAKERIELIQVAGKDIVQSLLEVLDDMARAEKQMESAGDVASLKEGTSLVFNKLRNILQQKGLQVMESKGKEFNPDLHEAITEIPAPADEMKGKVIDEVEPGYYLNDKLIRYAKVVVGK
ncbi:MAG: nucleotide exchange factor GrpE [Bacteroidetes bacterium 46-16]|nr:MAG: nucleotide exchange factor GrpE [Bacteroidetes bacterium 46-16]